MTFEEWWQSEPRSSWCKSDARTAWNAAIEAAGRVCDDVSGQRVYELLSEGI